VVNLLASVTLATGVFLPAYSQQNSVAVTELGSALYEAKCGGCHSIEVNRVGPLHRGLNNRKIGSVQGFDYSSALRSAGESRGMRWSKTSLDKWLSDPETFLPGQSMNYSLTDASQRALVIDYLLSL
jgi:cytochrome c